MATRRGHNDMEKARVFIWGALISFLGSLPPGVMNVAGMEIGVRDGVRAALVFSAGVILIELLYVRLMLVGMEWVGRQVRLFRLFSWLSVFILLSMAVASAMAALRISTVGNALPAFSHHPLLFGLSLSAVNPLHILFWMGWSSVLLNKKILIPSGASYTIYIFGIGLGTLLGLGAYIYGGSFLIHLVSGRQQVFNWIAGVALLIAALLQLRNQVGFSESGIRTFGQEQKPVK